MSMFLSGGKVNSIFANVNGETKKIVSAWANKDGVPTKVFSSGIKKFVIVGNNGTSYSSSDGITWTPMTGLDKSYNYRSVTYGKGRFVCFGKAISGFSTIIYHSTDGETWVKATHSVDLSKLSYGKGKFVSVYGGYNYYSADGINWVNKEHDFDIVTSAIGYGDGCFVAVGRGGGDYTSICYSIDGETWTSVLNGNYDSIDVTYGNGMFIVPGEYQVRKYINDNGTLKFVSSVTKTNLGDSGSVLYNSVAYGNGIFLLGGVKYSVSSNVTRYTNLPLRISSDGETWEEIGTTNKIKKLAFGNGAFVAIVLGTTSEITNVVPKYSIDNGVTWNSTGMDSSVYNDICYSAD